MLTKYRTPGVHCDEESGEYTKMLAEVHRRRRWRAPSGGKQILRFRTRTRASACTMKLKFLLLKLG